VNPKLLQQEQLLEKLRLKGQSANPEEGFKDFEIPGHHPHAIKSSMNDLQEVDLYDFFHTHGIKPKIYSISYPQGHQSLSQFEIQLMKAVVYLHTKQLANARKYLE